MIKIASKKCWIRVTFGEMAEHIAERVEPTPDDRDRYVGLDHLDSGSLTVRRWGADVALVGTKLRMRKGDILFAKRNAYLRRVALAPHDGLFSAHGMVLRARQQIVLPEFLPFFMQSDDFMNRAEQISVGSLSPTINWGTLKDQQFFLPPLEEQQRALSILKPALEAQNTAVRVVEAVTLCHRAAFDDYLQRGIGQRCFTKDIPSLRKEWKYVMIDELCSDIVDCLHRTPNYQQEGYPAIRTEDVEPGILHWQTARRVSEAEYHEQVRRLEPRRGDVFFSREGARMGIAALVPGSVKLCISQRMMHLRPATGFPGSLLMEYLNSSWAQRQILMYTGGSASPHINIADVRTIRVPLPPKGEWKSLARKGQQLIGAAGVANNRVLEARKALHNILEAFLQTPDGREIR